MWSIMLMHLTKDPQPLREINPGVPEAVEAAVMQALSKSPGDRPSACELAERFLHAVRAE
jgi:serine/threonine-protein kinase